MSGEATSEQRSWKGDPGELERIVLEVWREVLSRKDIESTDNFFDLGGRSMHVIMMTTLLKEMAGVHISPAVILRAQTISEIVSTLTASDPRDAGAVSDGIAPK